MFVLKQEDIRYMDDILFDSKGRLQVVPYDIIKDIPQNHISMFCVQKGLYAIPTQELIDFLKEEIGEQKAIEIGAGNGAICKALGIIGTDSFMQLEPAIKARYELMRQAIVPYGEHVEKLDAKEAVRKYRPEIVVAAWCTHKYNPKEHWREGNQWGINEKLILEKTKKYIHIGNEKTHGKKPILNYPHRTIKAPWIVSRAINPDLNAIFIWEQKER